MVEVILACLIVEKIYVLEEIIVGEFYGVWWDYF